MLRLSTFIKNLIWPGELTGSESHIVASEPSQLEVEQIALIETINTLYKYLETDLGYTYTLTTEVDEYPGGPIYYINKYTNLAAKRQVEVVVNRNHSNIYFCLKRLINGFEPAYDDNDNCCTFDEIDIYNGINDGSRYNPYLPPNFEFGPVKFGLETLKSIPHVLTGVNWFDTERLGKISQPTKSYSWGDFGSHPIDMIKRTFLFLETGLSMKIIYDYDKLRPFEKGFGANLVYSNEQDTIVFSVDLRDMEFAIIRIDTKDYRPDKRGMGELLGPGLRKATKEAFLSASAELEAILTRRP